MPPSRVIASRSARYSARNASAPIRSMTNLRRALSRRLRSPVRLKTRTTAVAISSTSSAGANSCARMPARRSVARPPPSVTRKPGFPSLRRAKKPRSLNDAPTQSRLPQQPAKAILNLRGSVAERAPRRRPLVIASAQGVGSKGSAALAPASGQVVTLRTLLPQASRLVRPASAAMRRTFSTSASLTKFSWRFCRVVRCPRPPAWRSVASASARSCGGERTPCGIFTRTIISSACRWP